MNISQLSTRITTFARAALAAATRKPHLPSAISNRPSPSAPIAMASILRPQARERWMLPQVGAITPQYIEMTLRGALAGAHLPQWELFNLMEDTWPRLRKNILELKMAVRNRRPVFEAYRDEEEEESPAATERMKLVSAALRHMQPDPTADEGGFDDMLFDILDAWFKGVSVLEIDWHVTQTHSLGRFIAPRCTRWANPIHYAWDTDLRLGLAVANANANAVATLSPASPSSPAKRPTLGERRYSNESPLAPFPADRFIVAKCKTKSGSILGGALLRPLVWWWCAANFSADWLLNLAQIFGLPFRWATYEPTAAQETVDRICAMLQNMGSAGWAAFPAGTSLELKADGQKSGAQTPQGDMLDRADKQCDLLVLGQTLTTDTGGMGAGGGSHALGQVHADVRSGLIDAAAKFTAGILEQQLIPAILRLNYGDCEEAPTLHLQPLTADNLQEKAAILAQLHAAGAGSIIPLDWLGKTFGIPKPKDGEATLAGEAAGDPARASVSEDPVAAAERHRRDTVRHPWNPDLHPRNRLGEFTYASNVGSEGPQRAPSTVQKSDEVKPFGPPAPNEAFGPPAPDEVFGPPAPKESDAQTRMQDSSDAPPLMPIPSQMPVVPDNVRVIALYNGRAPGNGVDKANGKLFTLAGNYYGSVSDTRIDISKDTWPQEYAKAISNYSYAHIWVYVFDHGEYCSQQFGNLQLRADSKDGLKLWDFLTHAKNVKYFHLFGCNSGAKFYGDPVGTTYNPLAKDKNITIDMSVAPYNYVLDQEFFPSTNGPIRRFPEK